MRLIHACHLILVGLVKYYKGMIAMSDEQTLKIIAANLARYRGSLSYSEVGRRAGTNASAISKIEKRQSMPGAGLLTRIADAVGCGVDDLLKSPEKKRRLA